MRTRFPESTLFQPTLPARGATAFGVVQIVAIAISTHAPRTGSDEITPENDAHKIDFNPRSPHGERLQADDASNIFLNFNPRSPHGERPFRVASRFSPFFISTHAPRTGSDVVVDEAAADLRVDFNPRSPHGERRCGAAHRRVSQNFNPRSPHGERRRVFLSLAIPKIISTHAPRTGSDCRRCRSTFRRNYFNPRSPHGERPVAAPAALHGAISTHAPRTGSDCSLPCSTHRSFISTHAPRTGSDDHGQLVFHCERLFQPTLPARGATGNELDMERCDTISTHAPRTGSDNHNSRSSYTCHISTHAPRTGSDPDCRFRHEAGVFQPTLPARGATRRKPSQTSSCDISTHAPRTGSDHQPRIKAFRFVRISTHAPRTGSDFQAWGTVHQDNISTHAPRTGSDSAK